MSPAKYLPFCFGLHVLEDPKVVTHSMPDDLEQ